MKKLLLLTALSVLFAAFTGCEKTDYDKLEDTVWEAETDDVAFTLRFVDRSGCTILSARKDGTYSANQTAYSWRYGSDLDSRWGMFFLQSVDDGEYKYSGTVENKTLYLHVYTDDIEVLSFKRR